MPDRDKQGKQIIPATFDYGNEFSEGLGGVKIGNKWGFISKEGEQVIPANFERVFPFSVSHIIQYETNVLQYSTFNQLISEVICQKILALLL